jgi:predicted permease
VDRLLGDVRFALRSFARSPGLTTVLLITLAVGTGANATVFSFVDALLFRPAERVAHPAQLVEIFTSDYSSTAYGNSSFPDYQSMRTSTSSFDGLAAFQVTGVSAVRVGETSEQARPNRVTADYFSILGVQPAIGRVLGPSDLMADAPRVAVIGYTLWQRGFGSDPAILGRQITVDGRQYAIVGVTARRFTGLDLGRREDVWIPLVPPDDTIDERGNRGFRVVGRLKAGATVAGAQSELTLLSKRLAETFPKSNLGTHERPQDPRPMVVVRHARLDPETRRDIGFVSSIILGATVLVLTIACANVASLLLSRATTRGPEVAVRLALGASRGHLVRQFLTESLIIAAGGGALGVLVSLWTVGALPSFFPPEQAQMLDARVDGRVFGFTLAIALVSGIAFGMVPVIQARRPNLVAGLRGHSSAIRYERGGTRIRNVMVVVQVALSSVLVVSTGLLTRSLANAWQTDLGYDARNVVVATAEVPHDDLAPAALPGYFDQVAASVRKLPGVEAAGFLRSLPDTPGGRRRFGFAGYQPAEGEGMEIDVNYADATYFDTMRVPLIAGRVFDSRDHAGTTRVVVVNDVLADRYFRGAALGKIATDSRTLDFEIVGVVRTGRFRDLRRPPLPIVFYPLSQEPQARMTLLTRTATAPLAHVETIAGAMRAVRPSVPITRAMTLDRYMSEVLAVERLATALVGSCSAMALVLAMVGVYGVMAFAVARRGREIGVRLALGARPPQIMKLVFDEGLRLIVVGVAIGLMAAAALPNLLGFFLHGISGHDGLSFVAAPSMLALVAIFAAIAPIRRALGVDPMVVLRHQ